MKTVKLDDLSLKVSSGLTPLRSNKEFWDNGTIPWLKTEQLGEKYIFDTIEYVSQTAINKTALKVFPENTLSIAMYGEGKTRGNVSIIKKPMTTNQACCNVELDKEKADYEYVYYFLKTQYEGLRSLSSGVRKNLNSNDIKNYPIRLPENIEEQRKIASILSTLDEKIALNNQINATLEQMAKTLYDYWFVQFDFPDDNGKPYKSSGGEMVYNKTLKRDIPKGWEVKKLSEIANLKAGGDKPSEFSDIPTEDLTVPIFSNGIINDGLYGYTNSSTIKKPSITISARGTIGFSKIRMNPFVPIIRLISITPIEEFFLKYLEQFFKDMDFENSGSVQQQLTVPQIKDLAILLPSEKTLNKFHGITLNGLLQIENNNEQIIELTKLRDWLLPMLMNGQVTVK